MNFKRKLIAASFLLVGSEALVAEVTLDGSLGGFPDAVVQPGNGYTYDIKAELGQTRGSNLFHSFGKFNINLGQQANFSGPAGINNIVSRITGGESAIAGKITSTIGGASLYLINPAGFVLTNGAVVDVEGSFYLSTVDYIEFGDGTRFFSSLSAASTLSTSPITSFGFLEGSQGTIAIDSGRGTPGEDKSTSNNLNVNSEFISIRDSDLQAQEIGIRMGDATFGDINIENTLLESVGGGIFFQGGNIYSVDSLITASGPSSQIQVRANSLSVQGVSRGAAIRSGELGASGGDIDIVAKEIKLDKAELSTSSGGGRKGGDITLRSDVISLNNGSQISLFAGPGTRAGDIDINTTDILIQNNSNLNSSSKAEGSTAGSINIQAKGRFGIESGSKLLAESENSGIGGAVSVTAANIVITDRATIDVQARGTGNSDLVDLKALDSITISNASNINASSASTGNGGSVQLRAPVVTLDKVDIIGETYGTGLGGDILIIAGSVSILNNSTVSVSSRSNLLEAGDAGKVSIEADSVTIDQTKFLLSTEGGGTGGRMRIIAPDINLSSTLIAAEAKGAGSGGDLLMQGDTIDWLDVSVNASIEGDGTGGDVNLIGGIITLTNPDINITAKGPGAAGDLVASGDQLILSGTGGIFGDTQGNGIGANIQLLTNETMISDVVLTSSSKGDGQAGDILINSPGGLTITNAKLDSQANRAGFGGDINISTSNFTLAGTGSLNVSAFGRGDAGHIDIIVDQMTMSDRGALLLTASGSGVGGKLNLNAATLTMSDKAMITGSVSKEATGDLLDFNTTTMTLQDDAKISSNTTGSGPGGTIDIATTDILIQGKAAITAETLSPGNGDAGLIKIAADQFQMVGGNVITNTKSAGQGGTVDIQARTISIANDADIKTDALDAGDGGSIELRASESFLLSGAGIDAITRDRGVGGLILIESPDITINNQGRINISALSGMGDAGKLTLSGDSITLSNGNIGTATLTEGDAGTVTLSANSINITDGGIQGETRGPGNGANILVQADTISITNAPINSSTQGPGVGGKITLRGSTVLIDGASIIAETTGSGTGGDLSITSETIDFSRANLSASANGNGNAGVINISATTGTLRDSTNISSDTTGKGVGGDITISANNLDLITGAVITSSATGPSNAGDVTLLVPDQLQIVAATVQTTSAQSGGGSIDIQTQNRIRIDQGVVSASANGVTADSGGGNISIDPELFTLRQSQIVAQANAGTGGNINLVATNFIADTETLISASSQRGIDGTVEIESPNQAVNPISVELNTGFQTLPEFISNNCTSPALHDRSYLVVENMNPVRRSPADYLPLLRAIEPESAALYSALYSPQDGPVTAGVLTLNASPDCT